MADWLALSIAFFLPATLTLVALCLGATAIYDILRGNPSEAYFIFGHDDEDEDELTYFLDREGN